VLVALLGAAPVLLLDATSYLVSFGLVALFVPPVEGERPIGSERTVRAGLRYLVGNRRLARTVLGLAIVELGFTALIATLPVVTRRRYHANAQLAGWLLASYGGGSVVGGLLTTRARSVDGRTARLAIAGLAVTTWPLLFALPRYGLAAAVAANGVCSGLYFSRFFASVTLRTPPGLRARVAAAVNTLISATGPVGFVGAGLLLQHASLRATYALVAGSATLGAAMVLAAMTAREDQPT
jgi:predicted MFS family arabinose efflux permease